MRCKQTSCLLHVLSRGHPSPKPSGELTYVRTRMTWTISGCALHVRNGNTTECPNQILQTCSGVHTWKGLKIWVHSSKSSSCTAHMFALPLSFSFWPPLSLFVSPPPCRSLLLFSYLDGFWFPINHHSTYCSNQCHVSVCMCVYCNLTSLGLKISCICRKCGEL